MATLVHLSFAPVIIQTGEISTLYSRHLHTISHIDQLISRPPFLIVRANPNVQYDALHIQLLVQPFKQIGLFATIVVDAFDECEDQKPVSEFLSALPVHIDAIPGVNSSLREDQKIIFNPDLSCHPCEPRSRHFTMSSQPS